MESAEAKARRLAQYARIDEQIRLDGEQRKKAKAMKTKKAKAVKTKKKKKVKAKAKKGSIFGSFLNYGKTANKDIYDAMMKKIEGEK